MANHVGKHQAGLGGGGMGAGASPWFPREGMGEAGSVGRRLASLHNFGRLERHGAVPGCVAPGPG